MKIHQPPQIRVNGKYIDNPQYKNPSRTQVMAEKLLVLMLSIIVTSTLFLLIASILSLIFKE